MSGRRANGEGSIRLRPDGRWEGTARVTLTDGRRKRVSVFGKTQTEALHKLRPVITNEHNGIRRPTQTHTVGSWLDTWLTSLGPSVIRPKTREGYESTIRLHLKPRIGHIKLAELRPLTLQSAINTAVEEGKSTRHILLLRQVLSSALSEAVRQELITRNVARMIKIPSYRAPEKATWSADQAARFLETAQNHPHYLAFLLAITDGLRLGEVLGLQWDDVDLDDRTITVRAQLQRIRGCGLQLVGLKTASSQRTIPLSDNATIVFASLARRKTSNATFVFVSATGGPIDPKNFAERTFKGLCGLAGVPPITFHEQRHTAATLYKDVGQANPKDAQSILGHAQVTTTMQIYQHSSIEQRRTIIDRVDAALTAEKVVKKVVKTEFSTGQSTNFDALTPGGPGGARTLDTLLKSQILDLLSMPSTPVSEHDHTRRNVFSYAPKVVKKVVKNSPPDALNSRQGVDGSPHHSCPLGHDTAWLLRELYERLRADEQAGGDHAA